ncbi:DUF4437 domain-containing protein [Pseudoalteromonas sp. MMG013]|nr:DUF4437 domain-containing protein [Pseudoalteromonas sp. MMG013]
MKHLAFTFILFSMFFSASTLADSKMLKVVKASNIDWGYLNPLRGDLSPGAANLWGDRTKDSATGMLVRFNKGFQSPPHIHNITYRGIVIDGQLHNDDPKAEKMWMPTGSYWTQPAGENHITAANGETNLIYLEIDSGPYLVKPSSEKFDNGERAINLHRNNIVWMEHKDLNFIEAQDVKAYFVWGEPSKLSGSMVKIPVGFKGAIQTEASEFKSVIIVGQVNYNSKEHKAVMLEPGSYIQSSGQKIHFIENKSNEEIIIYLRTNGEYRVY